MNEKRRNFLGGLMAFVGLGVSGPVLGQSVKAKGLTPLRTTKLRVWTLGDRDNHRYPTDKCVERLADILCKWDQKSDLDLIWGPDLTLQQFDIDAPQNVDVIAQDGSVAVEQLPNGQRRIVLEEPLVRIICHEDPSREA